MKTAMLFFLLLCGCAKEGKPVETQSAGKDSYDVEYLFSIDSVRVFRFIDAGRFHYLVLPVGMVSENYQSGKTTFTETIQTVHK